MQRLVGSFLVAAIFATAACGGGDDGDDSATATATSVGLEPSVTSGAAPTSSAAVATITDVATSAPGTTVSATTAPAPTTAATTEGATASSIDPLAWEPFQLDDCQCSDGSDVTFYRRDGDPTKVAFFLEGGGACFSLATCDPNGNPTYTITQSDEPLALATGLADSTNVDNPLADYTWIYVPYCTGDVHVGDTTTDYGDGADGPVVVEHRGLRNGMHALDYVVDEFPDVDELVVAGASAGSAGAPLYGALAADRLPDTEIVVFGDSSGSYVDSPAVNELLTAAWDPLSALPDWPEAAELDDSTWSLPGLTELAGQHAPDVRFGRFDYASDGVQLFFGSLVGVTPTTLVELLDQTEEQIEASGTSVANFVAPGSSHVIMGSDEFFTTEVDGVALVDWFGDLVDGASPPADVDCVECT